MKSYHPGKVQPVLARDINADPSEIQPRLTLNQDHVKALTEAYRDEDVDVPVIEVWIITDGAPDELRIIDGYHRFAAFTASKIGKQIRCMVREGTMLEAMERALLLNVKDKVAMSANEKSEAIKRILAQYQEAGESPSQRDVAQRTGLPRSTVRYHMERMNSPAKPESERSPKIDDVDEGVGGSPRVNPPKEADPADVPFGDDERDEQTPTSEIPEAKLHDAQRRFDASIANLTAFKTSTVNAANHFGGEMLARRVTAIEKQCDEMRAFIKAYKPSELCAACDGQGCEACGGRGYLVTEQTKSRKRDSETRGWA